MRYAEKRLLEIAQQFHDRPATVRQARAKSVPLFATRPFKLKRYQPGDTHKVCTECRLEKPLADFSVRAGGALGQGWLCTRCNSALWHAGESVDRLLQLVQYLRLQRIGLKFTPDVGSAVDVSP